MEVEEGIRQGALGSDFVSGSHFLIPIPVGEPLHGVRLSVTLTLRPANFLG